VFAGDTPAPQVAKPQAAVPVRLPEPTRAKAEPKPLPQGPNKLLFYRSGTLTLIDPDGKNDKAVSKDRDKLHPHSSLLSPDGKTLATLVLDPPPPDDGTPGAKRRTATLHVRGLDEKEPGTSLGVKGQVFAWAPDGAEIAVSDFEDGPPTGEKPPPVTSVVVNVKTKEATKLKLPDNHVVTDWSRDGRYFLTTSMARTKDGPAMRQFLMKRDGTEHATLNDDKTLSAFGRLSPDGKRVLCMRLRPKGMRGKELQVSREMVVIDAATKKVAKLDEVPLNADVQGYCWSPDGKRIAYTWRQVHEGKPEDLIEKETESHLVVCDPDGKNQKTLASEKGKGQWSVTIGQVDWR
jgi:Tol biopolymer transport system component